MAAPIGNQFWKLRNKHGRDRLFASPELLLKASEEYFQWCDEHPYYKPEQKKGNTIVPKNSNLSDEKFKQAVQPIVNIETKRPYTLSGLYMYLQCNEHYIGQFEKSIADRTDPSSKDFSSILTHIRKVIETNQIEGSMIGAYNPMITARLLGLKERQDITIDDKSITTVSIKIADPADD